MRADFSLLLFTVIGYTAAGIIEPPRLNARIDGDAHPEHELYKRRGGGGGGGRGGGGGGSSSSGSKGGSSSGSSGSSSGSRGGSPNSGSTTRYGGGVYAGGGGSPYAAGARSKLTGIVPFLLLGTALAFWPGVWLYGAYMYQKDNTTMYEFHNKTTDKDEKLPVMCACARFAYCGCENNMDKTYLDSLVGDGEYSKLKHDVVTVGEYKGTKTLLVNGTLANDTSEASAVPAGSSTGSGASRAVEVLGLWPVVVAVVGAVYMI